METFYTHLRERADTVFEALAPIAFVLAVFALWSGAANGHRSATMYLRALVHAIVVVVLLSQFPAWLEVGTSAINSLVHDTLQANPGEVYEKYKSMTASASDEAEGGFWHTIFDSDALFRAVIVAVLWTVQWIAKFVVFIAYVIHRVALNFAVAASPLFIGFLAVRSLSSIGHRFLLITAGIVAWPLGWGFASLVTDALLETMAHEDFVNGNGLEDLRNLIAVAGAGLWIMFSTIAAPLVIQRVIAEGTNAGTALLSGGWRATSAGTGGGVAAGAALAATGVGAPAAVLGGAGAGALAFGSSSLSGSGHSSIPGMVGNAAQMGKVRSSYRSSDPANDRQAAALVASARKSNR